MARMTQARWAAARALAEGMPVSLPALASVAGLAAATVARRARGERWASAADGKGPDYAGRIEGLAGRLIAEMEAIERDAEGGGYDKGRIDAVVALTRALEKLGEFTQSGHHRREAAQTTDADIADALRRMDERIVELARQYAAELVADKADAAPAAAGS